MNTGDEGEGMAMPVLTAKKPMAEKLLALRASAGDDPKKHAYYHALIGRYQRWLLRAYKRQAIGIG